MADTPGGYLAGFERDGFKFDSAIHWLNQCGEEGYVSRIFNAIGSDFPKIREQAKIRRFLKDKEDFILTNRPDEFKDELIKAFPHEKQGITRFFKDAKKISKAFDILSNNIREMDTLNLLKNSAME